MKVQFKMPEVQPAPKTTVKQNTGASQFEKLMQSQIQAQKDRAQDLKEHADKDDIAQEIPKEEQVTEANPETAVQPKQQPVVAEMPIVPIILPLVQPMEQTEIPVVKMDVPMLEAVSAKQLPIQTEQMPKQVVNAEENVIGNAIEQQEAVNTANVKLQNTEVAGEVKAQAEVQKQPTAEEVQLPVKPIVTEATKQSDNTVKSEQPVQTEMIKPQAEANTQAQTNADTNNAQSQTNTKAEANGKADVLANAKNETGQERQSDKISEPQVTIQTMEKPLNPANVNVKVAELPQVDQPVFVKEIAEKILVKLGQNTNEFQIELNPQELGKINIKILFTDKQAIVSLSCSNAKTQTLLAANAGGIRSIIEANVGQPTIVNVQQDQPAEHYQNNDNSENANQNKQQQHRHENNKTNEQLEDAAMFINRLRLGLVQLAQ